MAMASTVIMEQGLKRLLGQAGMYGSGVEPRPTPPALISAWPQQPVHRQPKNTLSLGVRCTSNALHLAWQHTSLQGRRRAKENAWVVENGSFSPVPSSKLLQASQRRAQITVAEAAGGRADSSSSQSSSSPPLSPSSPSSTSNSSSSSFLGGDEALVKFICAGPLVPKVGVANAEVEQNLGAWQNLGSALAHQLQFNEGSLSESELRRIFQYYLPIYFWCLDKLKNHQSQAGNGAAVAASPPLVVGISAPQGCGKTTVVESLEYLFSIEGKKAASISLDDFYLQGQDQLKLAASHPDNKLLELRGNAGSHDLDLAEQTLEALLRATRPDSAVPLPRYDKSAFSGRGDRAPQEHWPVVQGPVDVVLLEGWMLGFNPLPEDQVSAVDPQLIPVNKNLVKYSKLHNYVNSWIIIQVADVECVYQWRLQAEVRMRNSGKPGMTDEQVADFVSRYMPAYKAYLPELYKTGAQTSKDDALLKFYVDEHRNPLP